MKFCRDCKHLIGVRYAPETAKNWRCAAPANFREFDIVSGERLFIEENLWVLRSREDLCGQEGNWFELYVKEPIEIPSPRNTSSVATPVYRKKITADDL